MVAQNNSPLVSWIKERLTEIDATLASFERSAKKLESDARAKADRALGEVRAVRDEFQKSMKENAVASEAAIADCKKALEARWTAFEAAVPGFVEATGQNIKEFEAAFRARAEAQQKAWHEAIDVLNQNARTFSDDRRKELETLVAHMKIDADTAKAKLEKVDKARGESWVALKAALAETRAAFDKAQQTAYESLKRVA